MNEELFKTALWGFQKESVLEYIKDLIKVQEEQKQEQIQREKVITNLLIDTQLQCDSMKKSMMEEAAAMHEDSMQKWEAAANDIQKMRDEAVLEVEKIRAAALEEADNMRATALEEADNMRTAALEESTNMRTAAFEEVSNLRDQVAKENIELIKNAKEESNEMIQNAENMYEMRLKQVTELKHTIVNSRELYNAICDRALSSMEVIVDEK